MNYPPSGQHVRQNFRPQPPRQQSDYSYQTPAHLTPQPQHPYPYFHQAPPYAIHNPGYQYSMPQWYPNYHPYPSQPQHFYPNQPHVRQQPRPPPVFRPHSQQVFTPQPAPNPQPEVSTPSTVSQAITSPSTTPTPASVSTSTPPIATPKPNASTPAATSSATSTAPQTTPLAQPAPPHSPRAPFYPPLPWQSVPGDFPARDPRRRRRRRQSQLTSGEVSLPSIQRVPPTINQTEPSAEQEQPDNIPETELNAALKTDTPSPVSAPLEEQTEPRTSTPAITSPLSQPSRGHQRNVTKLVVPVIPLIPRQKRQTPNGQVISPPPSAGNDALGVKVEASEDGSLVSSAQATTEATSATSSPPPPAPVSAPPKSWAELFARGPAAANGVPLQQGPSSTVSGASKSKSNSLSDVLRTFSVSKENKLPFLEPRGLVNTGNMCYMNSILQVLVFCVPFYDFLDLVGKRSAHSFKSDTPLIESMIMFMREYPVIDAATSVEQLRLRLKETELEQYGDSFIPEYVYDVIKRLPRFSSMRRGHQQDAEEFLGFLLEGLHDECALVMQNTQDEESMTNGVGSPNSERPTSTEGGGDSGWLEVGPKQKASVTRSSGAVTESPVTKIFGGKLRSVLRVPGLKDSVTLEPYQPLQLDIGGPNVNNITDALKGLTHSETLHGEFNSPRGLGTTATKQVFIATLPSVLILHLKRFQYDNTGGTQKIWRKIGYPLDLELPKEVFPQSQRAGLAMRPGGLPKYRLISAVYHHGKSASGGHYTVDVRRQEGREWIRIDDTIIRRIRAEDVANEGSEEDPKILAKALEQHKRDTDDPKTNTTNIYNQAFGNDEEAEDNTESQKGWSQVNGTSPTTTTKKDDKKWSSLANGTNGSGTPAASTPGRSTPKASAKHSVKDNKVAYILFYQRVGG